MIIYGHALEGKCQHPFIHQLVFMEHLFDADTLPGAKDEGVSKKLSLTH